MENYMESNNNCNAATCSSMPAVKSEDTVKLLLEDLNTILKEIYHQVVLIEDAVHGSPTSDLASPDDVPFTVLPIIADLREKRSLAEKILKTTVHIQEGLW